MLLIAIFLREPLPSWQLMQRAHRLSWSGGVFGAIYIAVSILLLPRLGAATVIALIVAGQMAGAIAFDHFGILGAPLHPASLARLVGASLWWSE
jgi:transporter family-2 protein